MTAAVNIVHFLDIPFAGEASSHCHFPSESLEGKLEGKLEGQLGRIVFYYARLIIHSLYILCARFTSAYAVPRLDTASDHTILCSTSSVNSNV